MSIHDLFERMDPDGIDRTPFNYQNWDKAFRRLEEDKMDAVVPSARRVLRPGETLLVETVDSSELRQLREQVRLLGMEDTIKAEKIKSLHRDKELLMGVSYQTEVLQLRETVQVLRKALKDKSQAERFSVSMMIEHGANVETFSDITAILQDPDTEGLCIQLMRDDRCVATFYSPVAWWLV